MSERNDVGRRNLVIAGGGLVTVAVAGASIAGFSGGAAWAEPLVRKAVGAPAAVASATTVLSIAVLNKQPIRMNGHALWQTLIFQISNTGNIPSGPIWTLGPERNPTFDSQASPTITSATVDGNTYAVANALFTYGGQIDQPGWNYLPGLDVGQSLNFAVEVWNPFPISQTYGLGAFTPDFNQVLGAVSVPIAKDVLPNPPAGVQYIPLFYYTKVGDVVSILPTLEVYYRSPGSPRLGQATVTWDLLWDLTPSSGGPFAADPIDGKYDVQLWGVGEGFTIPVSEFPFDSLSPDYDLGQYMTVSIPGFPTYEAPSYWQQGVPPTPAVN